MLFFENDYGEGAHEKILEGLQKTNYEKLPGYETDCYCERAREKIKQACGCPEADVFFLAGGTQTNAVVIRSMLRPYEGVIAAGTGHVSCHEAGAIEYTGHKVLELTGHQGKIEAEELQAYLKKFYGDESHEHMVFPGMVYISHPTEYGTLYSKQELQALFSICRDYRIPLYIDGARLGYGLMSRETDVTLPFLAEHCHVFYIGGTKVGALCGEAVVFTKNNTPDHFMTLVKQQGALPAKGRLLGVQFDVLFTENLYTELGRRAIETAELLKEAFRENGYTFYLESPTNQQFILLEDVQAEQLSREVSFSFWEKPDATHTVVRFVTSWATREEDIEKLKQLLRKYRKNDG